MLRSCGRADNGRPSCPGVSSIRVPGCVRVTTVGAICNPLPETAPVRRACSRAYPRQREFQPVDRSSVLDRLPRGCRHCRSCRPNTPRAGFRRAAAAVIRLNDCRKALAGSGFPFFCATGIESRFAGARCSSTSATTRLLAVRLVDSATSFA